MKKIGITDSEKKLLFIVLALVILAASYFFGFTKLNDAAAAIEASNQQDASELSTLEGMVANQAATEKETQGYKDGIAEIIKKYPCDIPQEKSIYLIQEFQNTVGTDIMSIGFTMDKIVQRFSGDNPSVGKYNSLSLSYACDYDQFKELFKYIGEFKDRTTVPTINATYDQTAGKLRGSMIFKMYYLTNTDKEYEDFPPTEIPAGKAGIFYPDDWSPLLELEDLLDELANGLQ